MIHFLIVILGATIFGIIGAAAGGSLPYSYLLNKKGATDPNTGKDLGGILPFNGTWIPEAIHSILIGIVAAQIAAHFEYHLLICLAVFLVSGGISYAGKQSATRPALGWGRPHNGTHVKRKLTPVVNFIACRLLGFEIGDINYCRTWMAVKGFIITLPVGGLGFITWPSGYELGHRIGDLNYREFFASGITGIYVMIVSLAVS